MLLEKSQSWIVTVEETISTAGYLESTLKIICENLPFSLRSSTSFSPCREAASLDGDMSERGEQGIRVVSKHAVVYVQDGILCGKHGAVWTVEN